MAEPWTCTGKLHRTRGNMAKVDERKKIKGKLLMQNQKTEKKNVKRKSSKLKRSARDKNWIKEKVAEKATKTGKVKACIYYHEDVHWQ